MPGSHQDSITQPGSYPWSLQPKEFQDVLPKTQRCCCVELFKQLVAPLCAWLALGNPGCLLLNAPGVIIPEIPQIKDYQLLCACAKTVEYAKSSIVKTTRICKLITTGFLPVFGTAQGGEQKLLAWKKDTPGEGIEHKTQCACGFPLGLQK